MPQWYNNKTNASSNRFSEKKFEETQQLAGFDNMFTTDCKDRD